ncbi:hypothetical protein KHQ82_09805 [Mycoplasmatota bacterium]|nr:hypothetical protein KHQ82_09805 [Mycoplasmatota bacterium]
MDHIVYVDAKTRELDKIIDGSMTMIIRGATGRKLPYGRVFIGDDLYFIENNADGLIKAKATVSNVYNSEKLSQEDSIALVDDNQLKLNLGTSRYKKWAGKRYLVLIEIANVSKVDSFLIDKSDYGNMDDWLPVEDINTVKITTKQ